jgi:hypothetical protein
MQRLLSIVFFFAAAPAFAAGDSLVLGHSDLARLEALADGATLQLDGFPDGHGGAATLRFERMRIRADGARTVVVDARGERELVAAPRHHLFGRSADGRVRVSLWFGPGFAHMGGVGMSANGDPFAISAERGSAGATLRSRPVEDELPAGVVPRIVGGDDGVPSGRPFPHALAIALAPGVPAGAPRIATLAVDTDNELLSERFSGNTNAASQWIDDLIATMNVMYVADLGVQLQRGHTILRTAPDPYSQAGTPASTAQLTEFGNYWQVNHGNVPRSFAMLLSGKSDNPNSASGIAWVNSY